MARIGYFLSSEEFSPADLVRQAKLAEAAGFEALAVSDHYHPWNGEQGQSGFVWSTIGALSQATRLPVTTAVTCPTVRIHPAVVAQAAATCAVLTGGRFVLGVGSGEALNEHILGDVWPPVAIRQDMLEEAVEVMRKLWQGGLVTHRGRSTMPDAGLLEIFRDAGGAGKPTQGGLKVCWASDEESGRKTAHRIWPNAQLPGQLAQELPLPSHFEQASTLVTEEMIGEAIPCGPDVDRHLAAIRPYLDAGYDEVYVAQIGPQQDEFFAFYAEQVLPGVRR